MLPPPDLEGCRRIPHTDRRFSRRSSRTCPMGEVGGITREGAIGTADGIRRRGEGGVGEGYLSKPHPSFRYDSMCDFNVPVRMIWTDRRAVEPGIFFRAELQWSTRSRRSRFAALTTKGTFSILYLQPCRVHDPMKAPLIYHNRSSAGCPEKNTTPPSLQLTHHLHPALTGSSNSVVPRVISGTWAHTQPQRMPHAATIVPRSACVAYQRS